MRCRVKVRQQLFGGGALNEWRRGYQHVGLWIRALFCQTFHYHATTAFNIAYGNAGRFGECVKLYRYQLLSPSCSPSMEYTVTHRFRP